MEERFYERIAAAFVKGKELEWELDIKELIHKPIDELTYEERMEIIELGIQKGLKMYKFKRKIELPRVKKVLGCIKGLYPQSLLDIGSGRGTFLWPLIDEFMDLNVTSIDINKTRVDDINAIQRGGIAKITAMIMDATDMSFNSEYFDVVTALEVLEHIYDYEKAISEMIRVAKSFVIVSVPSKEDDNPEHIHLLSQETLENAFKKSNISKINFEYVNNHMIAMVRK